jgi:Ca2+-binding RTX toxin-like protein
MLWQAVTPILLGAIMTAANRLDEDFNWHMTAGTLTSFDPNVLSVADQGTNDADTLDLSSNLIGAIVHALNGDDTVTATDQADHIHGGAGDDTLTGGAGADVFHIHFSNSGNDTITDFDVASDVINISGLLEGYAQGAAAIDDYLSFSETNGDTLITFDLDGAAGNAGSDNPTSWDVSVTLQGVTVNDLGGSAFNMVENGLLIAEPDVL